jgi:hypothetical protein
MDAARRRRLGDAGQQTEHGRAPAAPVEVQLGPAHPAGIGLHRRAEDARAVRVAGISEAAAAQGHCGRWELPLGRAAGRGGVNHGETCHPSPIKLSTGTHSPIKLSTERTHAACMILSLARSQAYSLSLEYSGTGNAWHLSPVNFLISFPDGARCGPPPDSFIS